MSCSRLDLRSSVYEQGNGEMIENSQTLTRLGLGLEATNLQKLRAVLRSIDDIPRFHRMRRNMRSKGGASTQSDWS